MVERCIGIAEVKGSNPVQAWIFFRLSFHNCISCIYNWDDLPSNNSSLCSSHIWFSYIHNFSNYEYYKEFLANCFFEWCKEKHKLGVHAVFYFENSLLGLTCNLIWLQIWSKCHVYVEVCKPKFIVKLQCTCISSRRMQMYFWSSLPCTRKLTFRVQEKRWPEIYLHSQANVSHKHNIITWKHCGNCSNLPLKLRCSYLELLPATALLIKWVLTSAVVTVPSWDYFVLPLLLLSVFCSLHLPLVFVLESSLLLHFHKHNQCSQDQSMNERPIISLG